MPDYSEYIIKENDELKFHNHYRGDYTFLCDIFWGEEEAKRIISNQVKAEEFKGDNPFTRIIIDQDNREISLQIGIPENENGEGIIMIRKYLKLLELSYENWKINYLTEGYNDVIRFLNKNDYFKDNSTLERIENFEPNYLKGAWDEPKGALISKERKAEISYEYVNQNIAEIISQGEKLISRNLKNKIPNDKIPFGGIHINEDKGKISLWYTIEPIKLKEWTKSIWPDWEIEFEFWGYEKQYEQIKMKEELKKIIGNLEINATENLKEEIVNSDKEPFFDEPKRTYGFRPRKKDKEMMSIEFDEIIKKEKKTVPNK